MAEYELYPKIVDRLNHLGFHAWREHVGYCRNRWHGAPEGAPDIWFVAPGGFLFLIEVKAGRGKLRQSQIRFRQEMRRKDVPTAVVRSIKDVHDFVRQVVYPKINRGAV